MSCKEQGKSQFSEEPERTAETEQSENTFELLKKDKKSDFQGEESEKTNNGEVKTEADKTEKERKPILITSAKLTAKIAVFAALSFFVSFFEFPIFPATPFLKFDFSNVLILIGGFAMGPIPAVLTSLIKELLCLFKSSTGGVGEIANFIMTTSFILLPSLMYKFKKNFKTAIWSTAVACLIMTFVSLLVNRYINFPLFMGSGAKEFFASVIIYVALFNLIKGVAIGIFGITIFGRLYKILDRF